MSPLRVAFLGDPASVHIRRWLEAFVARGHAVALLEPIPARAEADLPAGVTRIAFRPLPPRLRPAGVWAARADLRRLLDAWGPDVLHAHYARRPAWHAWLSGWRPYVVTVWGSDVLVTGSMTRVGRLATRLALRDAALVTAATPWLASAAIALGARRNRVRRAQFGVDTSRFRPGPAPVALRETLGIGSARVVLSPRILAPLYRHEVVIETLAQLPRDVMVLSSDMRADPAERARLQAHAARLGVADRWRIIPAVADVQMAELYRLADVVVSVPESDTMPLTVMEAMASGCPAVVSDLPDARDWLGDLAPWSLVPTGDAAATAAALRIALSQSPSAKEAMAAALRARVVERADVPRSMDLVEAWYRELAAEPAPEPIDTASR
jgi:glycosyltransferase involved in cell wall biosynthesis